MCTAGATKNPGDIVVQLSLVPCLALTVLLLGTGPAGAQRLTGNTYQRLPGASAELDFYTTYIAHRDGAAVDLAVRVGVAEPAGAVRGEVLYLPGFADRFDNHGPLFETLAQRGLRVISFDYPAHGETSGRGNDLSRFRMAGLSRLAVQVLREISPERAVPLVLLGWSTGGLLAVRMSQALVEPDSPFATPPLAGVVLLAPGVAVRPLVGRAGFVTDDTLSSNPSPPRSGPIRPATPLASPDFALNLLHNAGAARTAAWPAAVPALVVVGEQETDLYVDTGGILAWARSQRSTGATMAIRQCPGAHHELDNEPEPVGAAVRSLVAAFATAPGSAPTAAACPAP